MLDIEHALQSKGFFHHRAADHAALFKYLDGLGDLIHVEDVVVQPGTTAMLKSKDAIDFHTDHHRAERILWHCLKQASAGGDTLLVDAARALEELDGDNKEALAQVMLSEHSMFHSDGGRHPLVTKGDGRLHIYYSLWLVGDALDDRGRTAVGAFIEAIKRQPVTKIRLEAGDLLVIDNRRMLHGRTAIAGDERRHLRRYWLGSAAQEAARAAA